MTTITWVIDWMQCKPTEGLNTDVVVIAGWTCNGTQDTYTASSSGTTFFAAPEGSFTPYNQLTQEQVLGWCWSNGVNQAAVEASIQTSIYNQINPPVVTLPLPWAGE
jgi:hypothetical protein